MGAQQVGTLLTRLGGIMTITAFVAFSGSSAVSVFGWLDWTSGYWLFLGSAVLWLASIMLKSIGRSFTGKED